MGGGRPPVRAVGNHPLRDLAAAALRAHAGFAIRSGAAATMASMGRLHDAVAQHMQPGNAHALSVDDIIAAFDAAAMADDGFLLRVSAAHDSVTLLRPIKAKSFVHDLGKQSRLLATPKPARNRELCKRIRAYVRRDLTCTVLPSRFVDEFREEYGIEAETGANNAKRQMSDVIDLLLAAGYKRVDSDIGFYQGSGPTWSRFKRMAVTRYRRQNNYLSRTDMIELARRSGHEMHLNVTQNATVEAVMRISYTSHHFQDKRWRTENRLRFALQRRIVEYGKDTLNKDDIAECMVHARMPETSVYFVDLMLPSRELTATDLMGTEEIAPLDRCPLTRERRNR